VISKVLIIGYGNSLRGDDGIGQAAARALANEAAIDGADVVGCHQLTPELAERLASVDLVVFMDAEAGLEPGCVVMTQVQSGSALSSGLVHHVDPAALLFLSRKLYGRAPKAFLVTVGAGSFELSESLSEPVAAALPEVIATVRRLVLEHLRGA
jgi:hydrogenase maturation protease